MTSPGSKLIEFFAVGNRIQNGTINLSNLGLVTLDGLEKLVDDHASVRRLIAAGNLLRGLPRALLSFPNLEMLDLSANRLQTDATLLRDPQTARWSALRQLEEVRLDANKLSDIPPELRYLPALRRLSLSGNNIARIGKAEDFKSLELLDLSNNSLTSLPLDYGYLRVTRVNITNNPSLRYPPPEIVTQGHDATVAFLAEGPSSPQWTSKLLIVGEAGVGKTSTSKLLRGDEFDPIEPTTHGLRLAQLNVPHPHQRKTSMELNCWDFGGQQIYHATHQFYLSTRSLFLLLWNARAGWEQARLRYWLELISARAPDSPVIVCSTHSDERIAELPEHDLKEDFPFIVGFLSVSNKTKAGREALLRLVAWTAAALPLMGEKWPQSWSMSREKLSTLSQKYISRDELSSRMRDEGVAGENVLRLTRTLHELGDILSYPGDPELDDLVVLRPQWVTEHIARILDSDVVGRAGGVLSRATMDSLWDDIPRGLRQQFLQLMERFDISYRIADSDDACLIVERLPLDPPSDLDSELNKNLDRSVVLRIRYHLSTLPPGIPTWFLARIHRFSTGIHWRFGALLESGDGSFALVRAHDRDCSVSLTVAGIAPQSFCSLLVDGLEYTLRRYPGLDIRKMIPCSCGMGAAASCPHEFDHRQLINRLSFNPPRTKIECPESGKSVDVRALLFGLLYRDNDEVFDRLDKLEYNYNNVQLETRRALKESVEQNAAQIRADIATEIRGMMQFQQRLATKALRALQTAIDMGCPALFTLSAEERVASAVRGKRMTVRLYCESPGAWHPAPGEPYELTEPGRWITTLGPLLNKTLHLLRFAAPLAGPIVGVISSQVFDEMKHELKLMEELLKETKQLELELEDPGKGLKDSYPHTASEREMLHLARLLHELDPAKVFQGLKYVITPEGDGLWLCPTHGALFDRRLAIQEKRQ